MSADTAAPAVAGRSGAIDDPSDLTWADYKTAVLATKDEIARDDVPSMAAGVAFKIFLALFPSLLAAVAIFGLVMDPSELNRYVDRLAGIVPEDALGIVHRTLESITGASASAAGGAAITGVVGGLWAATSAAASVIKALNRAYEIEESRNVFSQRLVALAITAALVLAIATLVLLVIAGPQVQAALVPEQLQGPIANILFGLVQVLLVIALLILLFAFVYWLGPNRHAPRWQWLSPGAVLGVLGWLVVSLGFSVYVQNFANYGNPTYGGIGGVIVLLVWLQLSMTLLLVGAELNAEVERIRDQHEAVRSGVGMGLLGDTPAAVNVSADVLQAPAATSPGPPAAEPPPLSPRPPHEAVGSGPGRRVALVGAAAVLAVLAAAVRVVRNRD